ncbi:MAG: NAD-binding protein [Synechococcus sp.]|nr:NAD-binding protein [Synechococcus sp.]
MKTNFREHFVVCGLGSLGQHCVQTLKSFGSTFPVVAIARVPPVNQEIIALDQLLDQLIIGDCCQDEILKQAQIEHCRAALIVTADERINAETALAIRRLNSRTRLVIRSGKSNFNQLLQRHLGNFIAFEPAELPAFALAWTALGDENLAWFSLDNQWLRLVQKDYQQTYARALVTFNHHGRRLLQHHPPWLEPTTTFYNWPPGTVANRGDRLIYVEMAHQFLGYQRTMPVQTKTWGWRKWRSGGRSFSWQRFWQLSLRQKLRSIAALSGVIITALLFLGSVLFHYYYPDTSWLGAFYGTTVLLLGGYGDLFGGWEAIPQLPWWLQLFALSLSVVGTAFVGILYALLTEALLSASFQFQPAQLPVPQQDHIILVGLDPVGQQIAQLLQQFRQPFVAIALKPQQAQNLDYRHVPLLTGSLETVLPQANVKTARSIILATADEMVNLEAALWVRSQNPEIGLVLRASGQRLSDHINTVLPDAHVLSVYALMAEAFAGAAFGENILNLFRLNQTTILVTEYHIEAGDTLNGLLLSDIAYGYGVVPLLHHHPNGETQLLPPEDIQLHLGDRLVVLATIESLRRIEVGQKFPKTYSLTIEKLGYQNAAFEATRAIARISGCSLTVAHDLLQQLPQALPEPLYGQPAERLLHTLQKLQIHGSLQKLPD